MKEKDYKGVYSCSVSQGNYNDTETSFSETYTINGVTYKYGVAYGGGYDSQVSTSESKQYVGDTGSVISCEEGSNVGVSYSTYPKQTSGVSFSVSYPVIVDKNGNHIIDKSYDKIIAQNIDTNKDKKYNKATTSKGESNNMSLVGLFVCDDGIVGFGDYKSTVEYNGISAKEPNRETQKVFKNNKFILVTFGKNEIIKNDSKIKIEDYINTNLKEDTDCEEFFRSFIKYVGKTETEYNFFVGKKVEDSYHLFGVCVAFGKKKTRTYSIKTRCVCNRTDKYGVILNLAIDYTKGVKVVAKKIEKAMKALIDLYSVEDRYQNVGTNSKGEVLIEIFK